MSKIKCEVCGAQVHVIQSHLKNDHGPDSAQPMTFNEYREQFPDAPIFSETAKEEVRRRKITEKGSDEVAPSAGLVEMGKHYGCPEVKSASGKPIMIDVKEVDDQWSYMIQAENPNFIYDPDLLRVTHMAIELNVPIYIFGPPGVGKSEIFRQISAKTNRPMFRFQHSIGTEESHILGMTGVVSEIDDNGNKVSVTKFNPGPLAMAARFGWIYLADEFDRAHPSVLSTYQAVLEGQSLIIPDAPEEWRVVKLHEDFRFVANGNTNGTGDPLGLYQSTVKQDAATFERFGIVHEVGYLPRDKESNMIRAGVGLTKADADRVIDYVSRIRSEYPHEMPLTIGPRVALNIAKLGKLRGSFVEGVKVAFANRLPAIKREAAVQMANRVFG